MTAASSSNAHHQQHSRSQHAPSSSSRSLHSQVQDAVSITRDRFHDAVSHMSSKSQPPDSMTNNSVRSFNGQHNSGAAAGLKDSWDALVKIMFAPCVNIGGVPREDMEGATTEIINPTRRFGSGGGGALSAGGRVATAGGGSNNGGWGASVPFEVSASTSLLGQSLVMSSSSLDQTFADRQQQTSIAVNPSTPSLQTDKQQQQRDPPGDAIPTKFSSSPLEQRKAKSRAKLRQLGARHLLASGFPDESLADIARPITPGGEEEGLDSTFHHHSLPATTSSSSSNRQHELVDFDDGISAISSHTLEEMERRRSVKDNQQQYQKQRASSTTVLKLNPLDFSQIIDEDCEWNGQGTSTSSDLRREHHQYHQGVGGLDVVEEVDETEVVFGAPFYEETLAMATMSSPSVLNRVPSTRTHQTLNTTVTEDTHEFEDMYQRHEALYWTNQDHVAHLERSSACLRAIPDETKKVMVRQHHDHRDRSSSSSGRMSIEERARRLRELSRSRSRSDGSGSSNKSGTSSLISGQHPHDTIPLYSFDLFPTPSWRKSSSRSRLTPRGSSRSDKRQTSTSQDAESLMEGSDPFDLLECSEI